jgi:hypothetical protein
MIAATPTPATEPTAQPRGFPGLRCPLCGAEDCVTVALNDVFALHCTSCDEDIDADEARDNARRWLAVLAWCELAPVIEE